MVISMTGFGKGSFEEGGRGFNVEIKSVNHRYFDINIKLPRSLFSLEDRVRKCIQSKLSRGKIDVFITQTNYENAEVTACFNNVLGDSYVRCLETIRDRYNVKDDISVSLVSRFPEVITLKQQEENEEALWNVLSKALDEAVNSILAMRKNEGSKLKEDVSSRCAFIRSMVDKIAGKEGKQVVVYRDKLLARIKELTSDIPVDQNRIATEVAIYADKSSIHEEIVRLMSHVSQLKETLELSEPIGRKMDFIVQEMNRETNTIASKADDIEIINITLSIKNEIEKIREQIQNIE